MYEGLIMEMYDPAHLTDDASDIVSNLVTHMNK